MRYFILFLLKTERLSEHVKTASLINLMRPGILWKYSIPETYMYIYTQQKSYVRFLWLCIFRPSYVVATKIKPTFFPNVRNMKTGNHLSLSSIPKELSIIMLKQHFSLLQGSQLLNRGISYVKLRQDTSEDEKNII